jgi:transcriptional antiterminator RfaH
MDCWYLIYSKPKQEQRAQQQLAIQGFETYCPLVTNQKVRGSKTITKQEPLFPRYIFIKCADASLLAKVRNTRGVGGIVKFGDTLATVSDALVFALVNQQMVIMQQPVEHPFKVGESLEILTGPFSSLNAVFLQADGMERCIILLNFLGQELNLSMEVKNLAKKTS